MDPDILAILQARPEAPAPGEDPAAGRRGGTAQQLAKAREAKLQKQLVAKAKAIVAQGSQSANVAALCIPGCAPLLRDMGVEPKVFRGDGPPPLEAMCRLAVSPKIRGSGYLVTRVRKLQHVSCSLLGSAALAMQRKGLEQWLEARSPMGDSGGHRVLGFSAMWDEATQKVRALLTKVKELSSPTAGGNTAAGQTTVSVMVVMGTVHQLTSAEYTHDGVRQVERSFVWQPWLAAPLFLSNTSHPFLLEGLGRALPANLMAPNSLDVCLSNGTVFVVSLTFDFASSNVASFAQLVRSAESQAGKPLMLHGERCATHCIHLVKARCVAASQLAGMLYSVSKVMKLNRTIDGLRQEFAAQVRNCLEFRIGEPPANDAFQKALLEVLGIDGDMSMFQADSPAGRKLTAWYTDVEKMANHSRFDPLTGKWLYYLPSCTTVLQVASKDRAVEFIVAPLVKVFLLRRWETAALSRWTGVSKGLKRMGLGIMMNGVLSQALGGLQRRLRYTQEALREQMKKNEAKLLAGEEADDTVVKNMSRVMKISAYFSESSRCSEVGVTLSVVSIIDKLHWRVLGSKGKHAKANLSAMVDPVRSCIATASAELLECMDGWSAEGRWALLRWFGVRDFLEIAPKRFARAVVLQVSAGLFRRTEQRFASWPYRLQLLISNQVSDGVKGGVVEDFLGACDCCLGPFGRAFRSRFPTTGDVLSELAKSTLLLWEQELRFTTAPVECEHKQVKDEVASMTSGVSHAPVAYRAICRHLHQAHRYRGGQDIALHLRHRCKQADDRLHGDCWPEPAEGGTAAALEDGAPGASCCPDGAIVLAPTAPAIDEGSLASFVTTHKLGGGNPKVLYLNYILHTHRLARTDTMSRDVVQALRRQETDRYDSDEGLQHRWRAIFQIIRRGKQVAQQAPAPRALALSSDLWPGHMQEVGDQRATLPISAQSLLTYQQEKFPTRASLDAHVADSSPFQVTEASVLVKRQHPRPFACAAGWHNVCRKGLAAKGDLRQFDKLQASWNKWIRSLSKEAATSADIVLCIRQAAHKEVATWAILADVVYTPLAQTFVVCGPVGAKLDDDGFFRHRLISPPYELEVLTAKSRLCVGNIGGQHGLRHETSDELLARLVACGEGKWEILQVEESIQLDTSSLRFMHVTGHKEPTVLEASEKKGRIATEDAFLAWERLVGSGAGGSQQAAGVASFGPGPLAASAFEHPDGGVAADALRESMSVGSGDVDDMADDDDLQNINDPHLLEDYLEEILGDVSDAAPSEGGDDALALGAAEPPGDPVAADPTPLQCVEEPAAEAVEPSLIEVVDALVASGLDGPPPGPASASSDAAPEPSGQKPPELGRDWTISELGYVRCSRPGFPNRTIGLVGWKSNGKSKFANCHMHSICSVSVGVMKKDVSMEYLAEWLLKGTPAPEGATVAQKKALGVAHRALWVRPE